MIGVLGVFGDDEGCGEGGNVEAEVEEGVAVGCEGVGVGLSGALGVGPCGIGCVGPVVFGFGVEVVRCAGASWRREGGEGNWWLLEIAICQMKDAVVVDGGNIGMCCGWGCMQWCLR